MNHRIQVGVLAFAVALAMTVFGYLVGRGDGYSKGVADTSCAQSAGARR